MVMPLWKIIIAILIIAFAFALIGFIASAAIQGAAILISLIPGNIWINSLWCAAILGGIGIIAGIWDYFL